MSTQIALRRQEFSDSLIERSLGRFGGWQMMPGHEPRTEVEIRSATGGALVSRARGAPLGAVEADVLTWLLAQWVQAGCAADGSVHTTLYQLTTALYGTRNKGTEDRRAVATALFNLHMASITLSDYDAAGVEQAGRWVDVHLVKRIHYGQQLQALQDRQPVSAAELGALRRETLCIYLDDWLIARLQREQLRAWLDWPVQRRLGAGIGKRLWLFLEPHPGFRPLRRRPSHEGTVIKLTDETYAELGANCRERRDNRKSIRRGIERIQQIDSRYVLLEFVPGHADGSDILRVIRLCRRRPQAQTSDVEGVDALG